MQTGEKQCKLCGYNKKTLVIVAVLVIIAGGAFYGGAKYEKSKLSKIGMLKSSQNEDTCKAKDSVAGEITAITDNAVTIKTSDGSTQNVSIASSLKNGKKNASALTGLAVGQQVIAKGIKNVDGSFSAQSIKQAVPEAPSAPAAQAK